MASRVSLERISALRRDDPVPLDQIPRLLRDILPNLLVSPSVLNLNIFCYAQQFEIDQSGAPVTVRTQALRALENTGSPNALPLEIFFMAPKESLRTITTTALEGREEEEGSFVLGDHHFNTEGRIFNVWDPGNSVLSRFTFIIVISRHGSAACLRLLPKKQIDGSSELTFDELYVEVADRRRKDRNPNALAIKLMDGMTLQDDIYIDVQRSFDMDFQCDRTQACGSLEGEALSKLIKTHLKRYPRH